jgi:uncharacterized membrane protein
MFQIAALAFMSLGVAVVSVNQASEVVGLTKPLWKEALSYGVLGAMVVYLLGERAYERWAERKARKEARQAEDAARKADREARHQLAGVLTENTLATQRLSGKVGQLTDVLYLQLGRPPRHDDTPPAIPKANP